MQKKDQEKAIMIGAVVISLLVGLIAVVKIFLHQPYNDLAFIFFSGIAVKETYYFVKTKKKGSLLLGIFAGILAVAELVDWIGSML